MDQAARDLVSEITREITREVDERCRSLEARLQEELEQKTRSLRAELIGDVSNLGESCQRACSNLDEELSGRLRSLEARVSASEAEVTIVTSEMCRVTKVAEATESKSSETSHLLEKLTDQTRQLERNVQMTSAEEARITSYEKEELEKRLQEIEEARRLAGMKLQELHDLCEQRFSGLQGRVEQLVGSSSLSVNPSELESLERICTTHMSATREAINEIFATLRELQDQVTSVKKSGAALANARKAEDMEDYTKKQIDLLREQHMKLSMRISEMQSQMQLVAETPAVSPQRVVGGGLEDSSLVRAEVDQQRQLVQAIEQNVERTALSGKAAIKGLETRVTRLQAQLTGTQQQLREELTVLLEELRKSRIMVDNRHFPSLLHRAPTPGSAMTPTESVGSTVPSTPDRTPFLTSGRSPVDFGGSTESLSSSAAPQVRDKKVSEADDACSVM